MPTKEGEPRIPYGSLTYDDDTGFNIEVTSAGTPVAVADSGLTAATGVLTQATASTGIIQLDKPGSWFVSFAVAGTGEASDQMEAMVYSGSSNATATEISARHDFPASGMADVTMAGSGVIEGVAVGDQISVKLDSDTNADSLQVRSFSLVCLHLASHTGA